MNLFEEVPATFTLGKSISEKCLRSYIRLYKPLVKIAIYFPNAVFCQICIVNARMFCEEKLI